MGPDLTTYEQLVAGASPLGGAEADAPPASPRLVGRDVARPLPRPVRHLIARWQQVVAARTERLGAAPMGEGSWL